MSFFTTRADSDVLVVTFETAAGLNDFRNNALRDSLYELVQSQASPRFAVDLGKVDYLSSSGVAILVRSRRCVRCPRPNRFLRFPRHPVFPIFTGLMKAGGPRRRLREA
jgi:hypothetical protein